MSLAIASQSPRTSDTPPARRPSPWWRSQALAALSGLLLLAAFPHPDQGWLAWLALVPLLLTFPHRRVWPALAAGLTFGVVFFGGLLYWLAIFAGHAIGLPLGILAWLIGTLAQAGVMMGFAGWAHALDRRGGRWAWRLGVPALWTLLEWMRQLGMLGTGWGDLAYSQHRALIPLQITKLAGVWGLTFWIVLVNVALAEVLRLRRVTRFAWATALVSLAALCFGAVTLRTENLRPSFGAAALQGDIDQNVPWQGLRPADPRYVLRVMTTYSELTREAAGRGAALAVWPETMFPGYIRSDPELRAWVAHDAIQNHAAILVGGNDYDLAQNRDANALFAVTAGGRLGGVYQKRQLVPFGEYVPFRRWFRFLDALHLTIYDRKVGAARQPVLDAGPPAGKVAVALCYESSYGSLMREQVARGANLLVIATDDTWFGRTAAARQHAAVAAVRAAETDRYAVRCAATGISQVIAPTGQVLAEAGLFRRAAVVAPVESRRTLTPYARWGDWFIALCGLLLAGGVALDRKTPLSPGRAGGRG